MGRLPIHLGLILRSLRLFLVAAFLSLVSACSKSQTAPWPQRVQSALREQSAGLSETERADFEAGFTDGAAMVQEALKAGWRPYQPTLNLPAAKPRFIGPVPEGIEMPACIPQPEVDLATGLILHPTTDVKGPTFARGQVKGFTWALDAVGQSLVHPLPEPDWPRRWVSWQDFLKRPELDFESQTVRVFWAPGLLGWSLKERGFPSRRTWRDWVEVEVPRWVGLSKGALWVETQGGQAIALDLQSSGILRVRPAPVHLPSAAPDFETFEEATQREFHSPAFQQALATLRKAAESGQVADLMALARKLRGMGEAADREAFTWYLQAAEKGDPDAMLEVGVQLFHGKATSEDQAAARTWLERAIQGGNPQAAAVRDTLFQTGNRPSGF